MTFTEAQMTYVHLVSWPSVWLPPSGTNKLLMLGYSEQEIDQIARSLSNDFDSWSWALYYVPNFDINNLEHVDWLIINNHIHNVIVNGVDSAAILMALLLKRTQTFCVTDAVLIDRICSQVGWHNLTLPQALGYIIQHRPEQDPVS